MQNKIELRRLPPLKALKGFEAATRHQSIRDAAAELCLTHPAISHQVQLIEEADGKYSLYCAVIVKKVDAQTRAKTSINELLRA